MYLRVQNTGAMILPITLSKAPEFLQKALADAIAMMFERMPWTAPTSQPEPETPTVEEVDTEVFETAEVIAFAPLTLDPPIVENRGSTSPLGGPIADLSLEG